MTKKIVIVEDDYIIQELHKHYVESLGHEVLAVFTTGDEAIEFFKTNTADLILMDVRLENNQDGIETMKKIQEMTDTPVVYITGNTEDSNYGRAAKTTNMKGYLAKPVSQNELENIIDSLNLYTDSVIYAQRIQQAIFPHRREIHNIFPNSIYMFRPKDLISGDFPVLVRRRKHDDIVCGVGDCTGHGVPAALLSVLCHEILTSCIKSTFQLEDILKKLNQNILRNLSRSETDNKVADSLDLIMFRIIGAESRIEISGVQRPFIYFNAKENRHEYYSFKGKNLGTPFDENEPIQKMEFTYNQDDYFYFFTDGITDQFGGKNNKKLMKKGLLALLDHLSTLPVAKREIEMDLFMKNWQGKLDQTDDILFWGVSPYHLSQQVEIEDAE